MSHLSTSTPAASQSSPQAGEPRNGVVPNFLHLSSHSAASLEGYLHLYVDGMAKAESVFANGNSGKAG
jgi:hypothetical protein